MALIGLAAVGILLASALGYWVARIGLRPLARLSQEVRKLAPPRLSGRLQLSPLPPELEQFVASFNSTLERVELAYSRRNSGAHHGLGLAIVKAIALMHGGTVFVKSAQGNTTFGIQLPR
ncbi:Heavy metal sensor histidine kinase [Pseudomonas syringae pv. cilantro]|uniref:histidine kinase n=1 Tax=Pseudomonas syringae pv. cilantro TaxID=81035 RepID=A0A0N0GDJ1_PSESX|nr:Heavy metal sensor histidine kinase [Pseudomonas syringae pv. cilantro]